MADMTKVAAQPVLDQLKRPRHRSPNYPAIGLEKALERTQTIKDQGLRHFISLKVAHDAWGYKAAAGDQTVAALKAFGLVEVQGANEKRQLRVSETAWRILGNAPDRAELLKQAALKPEIHKEIWEKYNGPPPSDSVLKNYLLWEREHKFNEAWVDLFIAQFRGTITYAGLDLFDKLASQDQTDFGSEENPSMQRPQQPPAHASPHVGPRQPIFGASGLIGNLMPHTTELAFKLSRESEARVIIQGKATQEAIEKLRELLNLQKDTFPTKSELEPPPRSAIWRNNDHDQPVTVTGELGAAPDGRRYFKILGSDTGVPENELEFNTGDN